MMTKLEIAARQALEALEEAYENGFLTGIDGLKTIDTLSAIREALAEQAEQEPVVMDESWCLEPQPVNGLLSNEQADKEPVACPHGVDDGACIECYMEQTDYFDYGFEEVEDYLRNCCNNNFMADKLRDIRKALYAAPVRTKDLTDDEIEKAFWGNGDTEIEGCCAVIAADREKNNLCERTKLWEKNK